MSSTFILLIILGYFGVLIAISMITGGKSDNQTFFSANKNSSWYLVAFGMIGASLSGVTFISVPGMVEANAFSYMQMVLGYLVGYFVIIKFLLPLYYRLNLISIYQFLEERFGVFAYKTGAMFFLISRTIGAAFRLFLVAEVFQIAISKQYGIPFPVTVLITIILIWVYTFRSGIKTIVWTDTLQTFCMLLAAVVTIVLIKNEMNWGFGDMVDQIATHDYSQVFYWEWKSAKFFGWQFLSGALISIVMTGLDQDMMQKNLTCKSLKEAQKNMWGLSISLVFVNVIFLSLGVLLFMYAQANQIVVPEGDGLFTTLALKHLPPMVGIFFILGVIAAAYSSADSALTSLTTSFCVDFLGYGRGNKESKNTRMVIHILFSLILFGVIMSFTLLEGKSVITKLFKAAGYTYGPLLGMFAFGIFIKRSVANTVMVVVVCVVSVVLSYLLDLGCKEWFDFNMGYMVLFINGLLTFAGMWLLSLGTSQDQGELETI